MPTRTRMPTRMVIRTTMRAIVMPRAKFQPCGGSELIRPAFR
ncbi:MAG: hypothetical protein O9342_12705 [Beijerinckiaceae bacterium]|nr:hypothetical protein [Beijerinckiaceae bacterium]